MEASCLFECEQVSPDYTTDIWQKTFFGAIPKQLVSLRKSKIKISCSGIHSLGLCISFNNTTTPFHLEGIHLKYIPIFELFNAFCLKKLIIETASLNTKQTYIGFVSGRGKRFGWTRTYDMAKRTTVKHLTIHRCVDREISKLEFWKSTGLLVPKTKLIWIGVEWS